MPKATFIKWIADSFSVLIQDHHGGKQAGIAQEQ